MSAWQDYVFGAGGFLFSIALLPSVLSEEKPSYWTSLMTGVILLTYAFTFATLDMILSAGSSALCGMLWLLLAGQVGATSGPEE